MHVFRVSRKKYASVLSGQGAAVRGARWNSRGAEMIYTAANRSLAMAEVAVHLNLSTLQEDYLMLTISVPDDISTQILNEADLQPGWNIFPYDPKTQVIGDRFLADSKYCVLRVPSAVTQGDHNFLINPSHREFDKIKLFESDPFSFDQRIFQKAE